MSLFRTGINSLVRVNTIVFDNFVNLKTTIEIPPNDSIFNHDTHPELNMFSKLIGINQNKLKDTIKLEDLKKQKLNQIIKSIIKYNENNYNHLHKSVLTKLSVKLKKEIYSNTYFEYGFQPWVITDLVRKYNITGKELFLSMAGNDEKYCKLWEDYSAVANSDYKNFDCYGMKNSYPINIYVSETKLNLINYVNRSGIGGYKGLIELIEKKIKSNHVEYQKVNEEHKVSELIESEQVKTEDKIFVPSMDLKDKKIDYFNRNNNNNNGVIYTFDLDLDTNNNKVNISKDMRSIEKLNKFKKFLSDGIKSKNFNLNKYFKYELRSCYDNKIDKYNIDNYILTPEIKSSMENISIINCIIFGEINIRFSDVEKLLSLVRFESVNYSATLDNFTIYYYPEHCLVANVDNEKINSMEFCKYQDIAKCAKWLTQVMNEINPNLINHHNYHIIVKYCKYEDHYQEQKFNDLIWREKYRIKKTTFKTE